jgi:hypothetical protein
VRNPDVADELRIRIDLWLGAVTLLPPSPRRRGHPVPKGRAEPLAAGQLHRRDALGGLIHEYERAA